MEYIYIENIMYFLVFIFAYSILSNEEDAKIHPQIKIGGSIKDLHIQAKFTLPCGVVAKKEIEDYVKELKGVVDAYWNSEQRSLKVVFRKGIVNIITIKHHLDQKGYLPTGFLVA